MHAAKTHERQNVALQDLTPIFVMKRRGDNYFPVSLETGTGPELPPKSIYVAAALDELNRGEAVTKYVAKTTLDMYEVEVAWNESEKQYEIVR